MASMHYSTPFRHSGQKSYIFLSLKFVQTRKSQLQALNFTMYRKLKMFVIVKLQKNKFCCLEINKNYFFMRVNRVFFPTVCQDWGAARMHAV